jgi:hypothetical protein
MTTENVGAESAPMDDAALFDALASGQDLPDDPIQEAAVAEQQEPEAVQAETVKQSEAPKEEHRVPLREHLEEREKRQAYEREARERAREVEELRRQIEAIKNPKQSPDFWEQPETSIEHRIDERLNPVAHALVQQQERFSKMLAVEKFGAEAVDSAFNELSTRLRSDPSAAYDYQRIMASEHPYAELVSWHRKQSLLKEIGTDPEAYKEKLLSDQTFLAKALERANAAARGKAPVVSLPNSQRTSLPSVSKMGAAEPIGKTRIDDDLSDEELWDTYSRPAGKR